MSHFTRLEALIKPKLKTGIEIKEDSTMRDLGVDSFDLVDIITTLEDDLNIMFEDEELYNVKTVKDVIDLLNKKTNN